MTMTWKGVMPAITTYFNEDLSINHDFVAEHCNRMVDAGCTVVELVFGAPVWPPAFCKLYDEV